MHLEKLKKKIKSLKPNFHFRKQKKTVPIPKEWIPSDKIVKEDPEKNIVQVEFVRKRLSHPTMRGFMHRLSTFLFVVNFIFGIMTFLSSMDILLKIMTAFFWLNGWMCLHVRKQTERQEWKQT